MRIVLGVCLSMFAAGCAHTGKTSAPNAPGASSATELNQQARQAYNALDFPACAEQFRQAAESSPDDSRAEPFYRAAGCAALAGEHARALELLERSVQSGYAHLDHLRFNPELSSLHALPGWQKVLAGTEANHQKAPPPPSFPIVPLKGIDVYGSRRVDLETVRRLLGLELGAPAVPSQAIFRRTEKALREQYNLAFAEISFHYYVGETPEDVGAAYITAALVDAEDARQLRFLSEPSGHPEDPEGLVAQWQAYETKSFQLMESGALDMEKEFTCRVAHCLLGFDHPELASFEPLFVAKVPASREGLTKVLREEADWEKRAATAYLLAYAGTPEQVFERLVPFIRDPSGGVRNNVLRVLIATQEQADHPLVDLETVLDALGLPESADRNKSLYLLKMVLEDLKPEDLKAQRAPLMQRIGPMLRTMAALQQPVIREPAVEVLKLLSDEATIPPSP
ncbi:MAG TPA: hypothetical protein VF664_16090 [Cystobacter sp.]